MDEDTREDLYDLLTAEAGAYKCGWCGANLLAGSLPFAWVCSEGTHLECRTRIQDID